MKANNPALKSALMKASKAEDEEGEKNYKRAFQLYKESVEILIPVAEGMCNIYTVLLYLTRILFA